MIAILPAAGKGTRMAAVTAGSAKEMLLVHGRPVIQWAIDEALDAEVESLVVVSAPEKQDLNSFVQASPYAIQLEMQYVANGLAPAVALAARPEPTLVILPDTLYYPKLPSRRIARALSEGYDIAILTQKVSESDMSKYGIVETDDQGEIRRIFEKPMPTATTSRNAVAARFGLSARMMGFLLEALDSLKDEPGEIQLTPILNLALKNGYNAIALPARSDETRYDCGSEQGYRSALEQIA
ncbi:MAG: hypothetical protein BGO01_13200 [Armatimonadetes bacterium 55-13]|nr:NTP transferase domain-containing protein [Armatimonadota bacterium]OJU61866.1 MAG: hypothetical protein BGO01_13200 [Armatimonadetes bacterium 55-13]